MAGEKPQYATWQKFLEAVSRFTANVEGVVDRVRSALLSSSAVPDIDSDVRPFVPRRALLPQGREALELLRERRRVCAFSSIADNWDSEDETDGSEDAFSMDCDMLCDDEDEDVNMAYSIAEHMERALAARLIQRTYRAFASRAAQCIFIRHRAAHTLQRAWRAHLRVHYRRRSRPLKRKRSDTLEPPMVLVWQVRAYAIKMRDHDPKTTHLLRSALSVCMST
ncbi:hypothetical protein ACHHYP_15788 [Achlya hypogyna]|uniref:Uncharacterized protein n=1 Tax=Achlya hypogyna TaxID=1202772 RepID=A0A1V9ZEN5_ACHHY|nr:hypothetical protein ACHHYP_15788 [Achlya hypogyna]